MAIFKNIREIGAPFLHDGGFVEHASHLHVLRSQIEIEEIIVKARRIHAKVDGLGQQVDGVSCATSLATAGLTAGRTGSAGWVASSARDVGFDFGKVGQTWGVGHGRNERERRDRERCGLRHWPSPRRHRPLRDEALRSATAHGAARPKNTAANAATNAPCRR